MHKFGILSASLAMLALAGCSGADEGAVEEETTSADPPGVAAALSIGGELDTEGQSDFNVNVNCAAALGITVETLRSLAGGANSAEVRGVLQAKELFENRAEAARGEDSELPTVQRAVAQKMEAESGQKSSQAQMAVACLRSLTNDQG